MKFQQKPWLGVQINRRHPLARGLVGCWLMNENTGTTVFDLSGNNNHGTIVNVDWVPNGLDFLGSFGKYVDVGTGICFDFTKEMSILASINTDSITATGKMIVTKFDGVSSADDSYFMRQDLDEIEFYLRTSDGLAWGSGRISGVPLKTDCSVAGTFDGAQIIAYLNGVGGVPIAHADTIRSNPTEKVYIGANSAGSNVFDGRMYYVYIYNRALLPYEVAWVHRRPFEMLEKPMSPALMYYAAPTGAAPTSTLYGPFYGPFAGPIGT